MFRKISQYRTMKRLKIPKGDRQQIKEKTKNGEDFENLIDKWIKNDKELRDRENRQILNSLLTIFKKNHWHMRQNMGPGNYECIYINHRQGYGTVSFDSVVHNCLHDDASKLLYDDLELNYFQLHSAMYLKKPLREQAIRIFHNKILTDEKFHKWFKNTPTFISFKEQLKSDKYCFSDAEKKTNVRKIVEIFLEVNCCKIPDNHEHDSKIFNRWIDWCGRTLTIDKTCFDCNGFADNKVKPYSEPEQNKIISCCVCLDVFKQPVVLPCGHVLCKSCTSNLHTCPLCRNPFEPSSLNVCNLIEYLIEDLVGN